MSIVLRNKQMLALLILAVFTALLIASMLLFSVWHVSVLHIASIRFPLPNAVYGGF